MPEKEDVDTDDIELEDNSTRKPLRELTEEKQNGVAQKSVSLINRLKHDKSFRVKFVYTLLIWWLFVVFGWKVAQQGPSLLDLQAITNTSLEKVSAVFTSDAIGYLAGSFLSGFLFRKFSSAVLFFTAAVGSAAVTAAIPWCAIFELMIFTYLVKGVFDGMVDTVSNAELFRVWKIENAVYVQALHFCFTIGSSISPSTTAPFLIPIVEHDKTNETFTDTPTSTIIYDNVDNRTIHLRNITTSSFHGTLTYEGNDTVMVGNVTNSNVQRSKLFIANSITAALYISSAILFVVFYFKIDKAFYRRNQKIADDVKVEKKTLPLKLKIVICCFLSFITFSYAIFDTSLYGFLTAFCVRQLKWTKTTASHLSSVYWAAFCLGRFIAIFSQKYLTSSKLLAINSSILIIVYAGLLVSSQYFFNVGVWICIGLAGLLMSPMLPTILTWTDSELLPVTGFITSLVFISGAVGGIVDPIFLGYMMDNIATMTFCYLILGGVIVFVSLFVAALCFAKLFKIGKMRIQKEIDIDEKLTNNAESEKRLNESALKI